MVGRLSRTQNFPKVKPTFYQQSYGRSMCVVNSDSTRNNKLLNLKGKAADSERRRGGWGYSSLEEKKNLTFYSTILKIIVEKASICVRTNLFRNTNFWGYRCHISLLNVVIWGDISGKISKMTLIKPPVVHSRKSWIRHWNDRYNNHTKEKLSQLL